MSKQEEKKTNDVKDETLKGGKPVSEKQSKAKGGSKKWRPWRDKKNTKSKANSNSPDWYSPDPTIAKLASAISMNNPVGIPVGLADGTNFQICSKAITNFPGVAANIVSLVPGVSTDTLSPINEASRAMMLRIRQEINANRNYEKTDLFKAMYAIANIAAYFEYLKTIYGVIRKYNVLNKYTPLVILRALRVDFNDINNHGIQLAWYINTLAKRLENLVFPSGLPIFDTAVDMFKHVYVDEDIAKAQFIVNVPEYFWKFQIDTSTGKGELVPKIFTTPGVKTYNDLVNFMEDLLSVISNDEDFAIMSGDIVKAYPNLYKFEGIDVDYSIEFEYSKEFLEKWHNASIVGFMRAPNADVYDYKITEQSTAQYDPYVVFNPHHDLVSTAPRNAQQKRGAGNRMLDFYDREVTPEQILVASQWLNQIKYHTSGSNTIYEWENLTTSFIGLIVIYYFDKDMNILEFITDTSMGLQLQADNRYALVDLDSGSGFPGVMLLSKWNYCPIFIVSLITNAVTASDVGFYAIYGDFGNYTVISKRELSNIVISSLYGQFRLEVLQKG